MEDKKTKYVLMLRGVCSISLSEMCQSKCVPDQNSISKLRKKKKKTTGVQQVHSLFNSALGESSAVQFPADIVRNFSNNTAVNTGPQGNVLSGHLAAPEVSQEPSRPDLHKERASSRSLTQIQR